MIKFVATDSPQSVSSGWIMTASETGQLIFKCVDTHAQFVLERSHFVSDTYKYRNGVLYSIGKILESLNENSKILFITEEAESVIDEIVTANRLLF